MEKHRILIVDCEDEFLRLLQSPLEAAQFEVESVGRIFLDGSYLARVQPDLMILGVHNSTQSCWDVLRLVRHDRRLEPLPVILVSPHMREAEHLLALELGADVYMAQPLNPTEVIAQIRALLRRTVYSTTTVPAEVLTVGDLRLHIGRHEVFLCNEKIELTPVEFGTLQTLMERPGYVLSRATILEHVPITSGQTEERTLDSHIKNLRRKLHDDPRNPHYIETVFGVGYRMADV